MIAYKVEVNSNLTVKWSGLPRVSKQDMIGMHGYDTCCTVEPLNADTFGTSEKCPD